MHVLISGVTVDLPPANCSSLVKPSASRVVFRHGTHDTLSSIRLARVGLGASMKIYQLLLSSVNPPRRSTLSVHWRGERSGGRCYTPQATCMSAELPLLAPSASWHGLRSRGAPRGLQGCRAAKSTKGQRTRGRISWHDLRSKKVEAAGIEPAPGGAKLPVASRPYLVSTRNRWKSISRCVPSCPALFQAIPQARATYTRHGFFYATGIDTSPARNASSTWSGVG